MDPNTRFGNLTFALLSAKRLMIFVAFTLLLAVLSFSQSFLPATIVAEIGAAIFPLWLLDVLLLAVALFMSYLEYSHYGAVKGPEDIKITRGLWSIEEIGIPYRRIKEVKVERDVADQVLGSATLVITTISGEEGGAEDTLYLPYLPKATAQDLSNGLLSRAEVEEEMPAPAGEPAAK